MSLGSQQSSEVWWFTKSCSTILFFTALIKWYSVLHPSLAMAQTDPVLGIQYNLLMGAVAFIEIALAILVFWHGTARWSLDLLMGLGCIFLLYHIVWWITGAHGLCPCLGNLFRMSSWMQDHQNVLVGALIFYLILGSLILRFDWSQKLEDFFN